MVGGSGQGWSQRDSRQAHGRTGWPAQHTGNPLPPNCQAPCQAQILSRTCVHGISLCSAMPRRQHIDKAAQHQQRRALLLLLRLRQVRPLLLRQVMGRTGG